MRHFPAKQRRNLEATKAKKFKSTTILDGTEKHCQWWSVLLCCVVTVNQMQVVGETYYSGIKCPRRRGDGLL